ncbi:MAG: AI-2E family transporter [Phycisphaerales bacterium]|nr:AI-2E family transporter [Phycisphaerales bacterium]
MQTAPEPKPAPTAAPAVDNGVALQGRLRHGLSLAALSLLIMALSFVMLRELTLILRPLFLAALVCYLIFPVHRWLVRHRVPSPVSVVMIVGAVLVSVYFTGQMMYGGVRAVGAELPDYVRAIEDYANQAMDRFRARFEFTHSAEAEPADEGDPVGPAATATPEVEPPRLKLVTTDQLVTMLRGTLNGFVDLFTGALIVLFYAIFLVAEASGFERRVRGAFGDERGARILEVTRTINAAIGEYIVVKTFISALVGVISGVFIALMGVKYALLWGLVTFLANFVPYLGSIFAAALPVAMAIAQFGMGWQPLVLAILLFGAQQTTGSYLEPRLLGRRLGISPLMILLSLGFWGLLWGVPGMLLAAPIVVTLKIILENIAPTRPIARMISNV